MVVSLLTRADSFCPHADFSNFEKTSAAGKGHEVSLVEQMVHHPCQWAASVDLCSSIIYRQPPPLCSQATARDCSTAQAIHLLLDFSKP